MSEPTATAPEYVVAHLEEALARDPRVSEQGLHVLVAGGDVFVTGTVASPVRREAIDEIGRELLPGWRVHNQADVADYREPEAPESETIG